MAKPWKEFEELVARIEGALVPRGASVKSPDRIRDKITGQQREVDASIRMQVGSAAVLITVECRYRVGPEDVTWIEQLQTKKANIGADKTIVVAKEFTQPAIEAAQFLGIETRRIEEVSDGEIIAWADSITVKAVESVIQIEKMSIDFVEEAQSLDPGLLERLKADQMDTEMVMVRGQAKSFRDLINDQAPHLGTPVAKEDDGRQRITIPAGESRTISNDPIAAVVGNAPLDGTQVKRLVHFQFVEGAATTWTESGESPIRGLWVHLLVSSKAEEVPLRGAYRYTSEDGTVAEIAEREAQFPGNSLTFTFHRDPSEQE